MNPTSKPYRLINSTEINYVQNHFERILHIWNQEYALFPINCTLERRPKLSIAIDNHMLIIDEHESKALLMQPDWSIVKNCVFGDISDCFDTQSEALFLTLLKQLFGSSTLQLQPMNGMPLIDHWFYAGAPSLALTLRCANDAITLYLHPQWVLKNLPLADVTPTALVELDNALASEKIHLHVELNPVPLTLTNMLRLKVGDVIKTDHLITTPLRLSLRQKTVCNVEIGKEKAHKSIQIARL